MSDKTTFLIAHGASVGIVRDGKKKTIAAGQGFEFTEDEIAAVKRASPGALRAPINEGTRSAPAESEEDEDGEAKTSTKSTKTPAAKKPKAPAKEKAGDADEDEDI